MGRRQDIEMALATLEQGARYSGLELGDIERAIRTRLAEWDTVLARQGDQARSILGTALVGRLLFTPGEDADEGFYEYVARWSIGGVLAGLIPF